jgi:predicted MFS family arabinose efflux permease
MTSRLDPPMVLPPLLTPLRNPTYRALWLATLASYFGVWMQSVGAAWLMASIAPTVDFVAWVQAANSLPPILFTMCMWGGALADRMDQRFVLLVAQAGVLSMAVLMAALDHYHLVTPWLLLALVFGLDSFSAIRYPAFQTTVNRLLPREELPHAMVLSSIGWNVARAAGPGLGGAVIALFGAKAAFGLNALLNLPIIAVLFLWRRRAAAAAPAAATGNLMTQIAEGFGHVRAMPVIRSAVIRCFVFTLFASALWSLLPAVAKHSLGGGPEVYGAMLGALGIGALCGAFFLHRLRGAMELRLLFAGATAIFAPGLPALALAASPYVLLPILGIAGMGWMAAMSSFSVVVQLCADRAFVGRAVSIYYLSLFGGFALGSWLWGVVAHHAGIDTALFAALAGLVLSLALYGRDSNLVLPRQAAE